MIKIGFVEENDLLREGITMCLNDHPEVEFCLSIENCQSLKETRNICSLDVVVFDTCNDDDFMVIRELQEKHPKLKFILLSALNRLVENYLFYQSGSIHALLSKKINLERLIAAVFEVSAKSQSKIIEPKSLRELVSEKMVMKNTVFTKKECTILSLIGKGKTNKEASEILNLSYRTIETHRRRMIEKLGCKNIIPVVLYAIEKKYINIEPDEDWFWDELDKNEVL